MCLTNWHLCNGLAQSVWQGDVSRRLLDAAAPATLLQPTYRIEPASPHITLGHFTREGHPLILLVNVGRQDYDGRLSVAAGREWHALDPAQRLGSTTAGGCRRPGAPIHLAPRETRLLLGSETK